MADELYLMQGARKTRMEDLPPEAWKYLAGGDSVGSTQDLYSTVSVLFRCINARADAASSIPFRIENSRGRAVETSDNWNGGFGWLPNPRLFIRQAFMSLDFTNAVYAKKLKNRFGVAKGLQYFVPSSIKPKFDDNGDIFVFERTAGKEKKDISPEEMMYMFIQDAFVEAGASTSTPVKAALRAAGVLSSMEEFVDTYFKEGAIDPVIGAIPRNTPKEERQEAESLLNRMLTGLRNVGKIRLVPVEDVKITQPLRNGLESLKKTELTKEQRENISIALSVPLSFLLGNQANYATATQEEKTLIRWGVQPRLEQLVDAISDQLYKPMNNHRLRADFDQLEMFQEEEVNKMATVSSLLDVVNKAQSKLQLEAAFTVIGIDATPEQIERLMPEKKKEPTVLTQEETAQDEQEEINKKALVEIGRWEKKSINAGKLVTWHTLTIPENVRKHILESPDWKRAFSEARDMMSGHKTVSSDTVSVLEAIRLGVKALEMRAHDE